MVNLSTTPKIAQTFAPVKPSLPPIPSSPIPLSPLTSHDDDDEPRPTLDIVSSSSYGDEGLGEGEIPAAATLPSARSELDELIADLQSIGFDMPMEYLARNSLARVRAALDYARSKPFGQVRNVPGYIRFLVKSTGRIPKRLPDPPQNKYLSGKYGHMVRH